MAIGTYSELKTAVANDMHRTDLTDRIPEFISQAEGMLRRDLDCPEMELVTTLTATAGVDNVSLPSGFIQLRTAYIDGDPKRLLEIQPLENLYAKWAGSSTGKPYIAGLVGKATMYLGPIPDSNYSINIVYKGLAALSDASPTNWLLTTYPDIYMAATRFYAMRHIRNDEGAVLARSEVASMILSLNNSGWDANFSTGRIQTDINPGWA